jgi:allantoinase
MLVIRGQRVVLPDGERPASIHVQNGTIAAVAAYDDVPTGADIVDASDAGDLVISPGIVDTHVHVNEPGRTEWEGFDTATRAAAAGGVTTIVDMPLNSVPATTTVAGLAAKREAAAHRCHVDVAFWGGVVPGNQSQLDGLIDAGVRGFKCFLVPSGVDEFPAVAEEDLRRALPTLARRGVPLLVHAETPALIRRPSGDPRRYASYLATRPAEAEVDAVALMIRLASEFHVETHIVHVAARAAVETIARAQSEGVPISAETCPHYLTFAAGDIPDGATLFKCAPPIREATDREALWDGLRRGVLGLVATDHSPAPPALKSTGDFTLAWGGIASLELALPVVWTEARPRGFAVADLARWMSDRPAVLAGLSDRKGRIAPGHDADVIMWDPDRERFVDAEHLQQRHKLTPYAGRWLRGAVHTTFVRGERVWQDGDIVHPSAGRLL